jgi:branched-chain amino acid transport system substrate-binding protein
VLHRSAKRFCLSFAAVALAMAMSQPAAAQKKYDPGASDTEIKIGNIMPYSGPASSFSVVGKTQAAYFKKINDEGGINGRKINFISYDDGYSPPKAVEQTRKLVESDEVLLVFSSLGTPSNTAVHKYLNAKKVPQLFVASGAAKWADPKNFPWTMGWQPSYYSEGHIYASYVLNAKPQGKIAVLYQNDDYGKDILKGLRDGLGSRAAAMIVAEEAYEASEPTIESRIVKLKASNADVFINIATPKFAAQAIKKNAELSWKPLHILNNISSSLVGVIKPAGFDNAQGILSATFTKDATDPQWKADPGIAAFDAFLTKHHPDGNRADFLVLAGYSSAETLVDVLRRCGDDLTRENVMKQAASINNLQLAGLLPGIRVNTGPKDYAPLQQLQMMRLAGEKWELFGDVLTGAIED